jgi:hypothetical protein
MVAADPYEISEEDNCWSVFCNRDGPGAIITSALPAPAVYKSILCLFIAATFEFVIF